MKYRSDILRTIHESAVDKFAIGAISEVRMREFDEMCLVPEACVPSTLRPGSRFILATNNDTKIL